MLTVGGTIEVNANMSLAARTETVTVTAEAPSTLTTVATGQSLSKKGEIDALPIGRRPVDIAELSPGLTTNTFIAGQLAISGAYGFDNVFMVDGVDVNDTINGTANNLYIEDAIQNTTVLTNGISAEYGRFSGGVVNLVTRSGGNMFSGSFRENLSNPAWISETPLERPNRRRAPEPARQDARSDVRRTGCQGPALVLRRWTLGDDQHAEHVLPDRRRLHAHRQEPTRRVEADRALPRGRLDLRHLHQQQHRAGERVRHRCGRDSRFERAGDAHAAQPSRWPSITAAWSARHCSRRCSIRRRGSSSGTTAGRARR